MVQSGLLGLLLLGLTVNTCIGGQEKPSPGTCSDKWKGYGKCYQMMMKGKCDETNGNCKKTCGMCGKCKDKEKKDKCKEMMEAGECTDIKLRKYATRLVIIVVILVVNAKIRCLLKKCKKMMKAGKCE